MEIKRKKLTNVLKYIILSMFFLGLLFFCLFNFGFLSNFSSVKFDKTKLNFENSNILVYDIDKKVIDDNKSKYKKVQVKDVPQNVIDAFVSIEDKSFYNHKGVNYKRMVKALMKNITSKSLKEGASTISQQVIKNTHLTNEKTFNRKINEILLTQKLEKNLSKDEIMTSYLNAIYFGNGAFGINEASQRYFSKDVSKLNLEEGAMLAGIIKSPSKYSPLTHSKECIDRRNLVLKQMYENNKITKEEYENAINTELNLNIDKKSLSNNSYYSATINEACKILHLSEKDLLLKRYKLYTYQDSDLQKIAESEISNSESYCKNNDVNSLILSVDNKTGGVNAFCGKSNYDLLSLHRQPGSVFKPIISYAPALENNIISPLTPILDEKININGYEPKNYKNTYHGWTSAKDCLAKSLNVPSVKLLDYIGIDKAKAFASNLGINFEPQDNGYSLALGGMTKGVKFLEIANCYQCFGNYGKFVECGFIKEIRTEDDKIIYKHNEIGKQVMKKSTSYLLSDMLKESVKTGTCKKLNLSKYDNICAKTGTVGIMNSSKGENSDVWSLSYTPKNTLCVWFGNTDNKTCLAKNITGANTPTFMAQSFYNKAKLNKEKFNRPEDVTELKINLLEYTNNQKIMLSSPNTPERFTLTGLFSNSNMPKETSSIFDEIEDINIKVKKIEDNKIEISFLAKNYLEYEIIRKDDDNTITLNTIKNKNEIITYIDDTLSSGNLYSYYVLARFNNQINQNILENTVKKSNEVKMFLT